MRLRPNEAQAFATRASVWLGKNQPEKAVEGANTALRLAPGDSYALSYRGCAYVQLGKYSLAIDDLTQCIDLTPADGYSLTWRAIALWESKDDSGTIADATRALEVDPLNTSALYHRAMAYERQQLLENAYSDFSKCISIDGGDSGFVLARGKLLLKMQKPLEAVVDLSTLILRFPEDWEIQAVARVQLREYDTAIQSYTSALKFDPDDATVLLERGKLYLEKRALTAALADFNRTIRLNPNFCDAYYCRAIVHQELGDTKKAEADFNAADELQMLLIPSTAPGAR